MIHISFLPLNLFPAASSDKLVRSIEAVAAVCAVRRALNALAYGA